MSNSACSFPPQAFFEQSLGRLRGGAGGRGGRNGLGMDQMQTAVGGKVGWVGGPRVQTGLAG